MFLRRGILWSTTFITYNGITMLEVLISPFIVPAAATISIPGWDKETFTKSADVNLNSAGEYVFPNSSVSDYPDYLRIPYLGTPSLSLYPPITTVTMECRVDQMIQGNHCIIWSRYRMSRDANSYSIGISPSLNVSLIINNKVFNSVEKITLGVPFTVETRREATMVYVYLNGSLVISYTIPSGTMNADAPWDWVFGTYLSGEQIVGIPGSGRWNWRLIRFEVKTY